MTDPDPARGSGAALPRRLSLAHLVVYGLLFIGPLAPASIFGVLDAQSHGAVALVYAVATLVMACTAWSYGQMSRHVPHAGSVFAYAREGLGPAAAFVAGWMAMLDYLLIPALAFLFSGIALHALLPAVPSWVFTLATFVVTNVLNFLGARTAARAGGVMLGVEVVVLVVFVVGAIVVLAEHGPTRPWSSPFTGAGAGVTATALLGAVSVAVLSFLGFDAIASFAEENAGDVRQVGRAIGTCLAVAGIVFVLQSYLAAVLSVSSPEVLAANPAAQETAFFDLTGASIGAWLGALITVTKAVGPAFAAMTGQAAAARLLFGMARDGSLPSPLAHVGSRHGVPLFALGASGLLTLGVAVGAARRQDGLSLLSAIVNVGALSAFVLLHAAVIGYFVVRRRAAATLAHRIVPVIGAAATVWIIVNSGGLAQRIAAAWLAVGVAWSWVRRPAARG
jgi:amino acid transporter